jgi:hypothetical protein
MEQKEPLPVLGYTSQTDNKIAMVNANKVLEEQILRRIEEIGDRVFSEDGSDGNDYRWILIAQTHIEQGFMALNRAIFQPKRLETLP